MYDSYRKKSSRMHGVDYNILLIFIYIRMCDSKASSADYDCWSEFPSHMSLHILDHVLELVMLNKLKTVSLLK